jgi:hypothetical protein
MRGFSRIVIAGAAIAAMTACSDSATSPKAASERLVAPGDRPSLDYQGSSRFGGSRSMTFTLTSAGGKFEIGDLYELVVPANAVCVLGSSYGPGTWDQPCATLSAGQSVKVTATYGFGRNGPVVDFSPDIRFSPRSEVTLSTDLYAPILLAFRGYFSANPSGLRYFGIYYTEDFGTTSVADALVDASLTTHVSLKTGSVWRRIKHFSGYNIAAGAACDLTLGDPDCKPTPAPIVDTP